MKTMIRWIVLCFMCLGMLCCQTPIGNISPPDAVAYTEDEAEIFAGIALLGQYKADAAPDEMAQMREALEALGAKPTRKQLAELTFGKAIFVNGIQLENCADFADAFADLYEIWGVAKTVTTEAGTYETYDLILQPTEDNHALTAQATRFGETDFDLYNTSRRNAHLLKSVTGALGDILFEKSMTEAVRSRAYTTVLSAETELLQNLSLDSDVFDADTVIAHTEAGRGYTKSYRIACTATPTMHLVFVREDHTDAWRHTLTTNFVHIQEEHAWYFAYNAGHGNADSISGETSYDRTVFPERYTGRLSDAIVAYASDDVWKCGIRTYTVRSLRGKYTADIFTLEIYCPNDVQEIVHFGLQVK